MPIDYAEAKRITEDFLSHLGAGEYKILDDSEKHKHTEQSYIPIRDNLIACITEYTEKKNCILRPEDGSKDPEVLLHFLAVRCAVWIRKARMENLIIEVDSSEGNAQELKVEIENLRQLNYKLSKENEHLKKQVAEFHKVMGRFDSLKKPRGDNNQ